MYWKRYVPVAQRRRKADREVARLKKSGQKLEPVLIEGRTIASTFWGKAWCENLESFSDFENRLPRGRTYARNGSVIDLRVERGRILALVSGSEIYQVSVTVRDLDAVRWQEIKRRCAGAIGSLVELLEGKLSKGVMQVVASKGEGLFPEPGELKLGCSCPDWARMCKHVAAVLYGLGARLDLRPEALFLLRGVDPSEMVDVAVLGSPQSGSTPELECDDLAAMFGIDLAQSETPAGTRQPPKKKAASDENGSARGKAPAGARKKTSIGEGKGRGMARASGDGRESPAVKATSAIRKPLTLEQQALATARREGRIATGAVMQRFGLARIAARSLLERLTLRGKLRRVGERGRGVHYVPA